MEPIFVPPVAHNGVDGKAKAVDGNEGRRGREIYGQIFYWAAPLRSPGY